MSGLRRSARSQVLRNPRYPEDHGHADPYANQANEVAQGMGMMGFGNMGTGYHAPSDLGYYNAATTAYHQYHQNPGYSHYQNTHHYQHQYPTHHGFHHAGDVSQTAQEDPHSTTTTSSGRTLRARNTGGAVASSSSASFNPSTHGGNARGKRTTHGSSAGSSHQFPQTPGGNVGQDSGGEEDDRDEEDGNANAIEAGSSTKSKKGLGMDSSLTLDQMVQNCLYYLLLMQHKKVPVKRSDLIKNAMNSQHKQFPEVIKKLKTALKDVFGMTLVRLEKGKDNNTSTTGMGRNPAATAEGTEEANSSDMKAKGKGGSSESYILISKFPSSVCDSVMRRDPEVDSKKTVLYLVLATIFMLNRAVDEEVIWKIILEMQLDQMVCEKKSDLRKFLKSEFVSSGYLNSEMTAHNSTLSKYNSGRSNENNNNDKSAENDDIVPAKYSWGPRAHMEYSKYSMLKFVTNRFQGRRPYEFTVQYSMLSKAEKALAEKDLIGDNRDSDPDNDTAATASGESGSAIQIKQKKGGKGETYFIDGEENTETETEET